MYADDTHLTYAGHNADNIQLHLNQDLENVHNWLRAIKLTLNMTKTTEIVVDLKSSPGEHHNLINSFERAIR